MKMMWGASEGEIMIMKANFIKNDCIRYIFRREP